MSAKEEYIIIEGAKVNNLKNVSLKIPRGKLTVISGLSGSGKSSLAFETLFAEGQRRFAESLSSFARQFLGRMSKPSVEKIEGIPPAIAISQKVNSANPRSTVGTTTEIYDYLRVLYAKIGHTYSPVSGREVKCENINDVLRHIFTLAGKVYIVCPVKWGLDDKVEQLLNLSESGFSRLFNMDSKVMLRISDLLKEMGKYKDDSLYLLIGRFSMEGNEEKPSEETVASMQDSLQTAFDQGGGHLAIVCETPDGNFHTREFSNIFESDGIVFEKPTELMFSYNNPLGACPVCKGLGMTTGIDETLVVPNSSLSVYEGAIAPWRGEIMGQFQKRLILNAPKFGFPIHKPYAQLTAEQKELLWKGNRYFTGINSFFEMVDSMKYKIQYKYLLSRYSGKTVCHACHGSRLKKECEYVKVGGKSISELMSMSIDRLYDFFSTLKLDKYEEQVAGRAIKEITGRLGYIKAVGLGYLTLSRYSNTLSGGESQRISLVSSLGNSLIGSLYILDEPSIGLHRRDTGRLIEVVKNLRDLGNTVIIVEHDAEIIKSADYLVDIGPLAGVNGGEIVYAGTVRHGLELAAKAKAAGKQTTGSLTLDYLGGLKSMPRKKTPRTWKNSIKLSGCMEHNLKNITAEFPIGVLTVVTGVSGSGKSTLVGDTLYPALLRHFNKSGGHPGAFKELSGSLNMISSVVYIDQNPIGKSVRSNPVTYLKIYDDIRKIYSEQPYARINGYGHSHFSFNIDGGRCPQCLGEGTITVPMQFMADVTVVCEECGGKRFKPDILEVKYHGMNINDILEMSVGQAIDFFSAQSETGAKRVANKLKILEDVGLGYVKLGQSISSLSGGESQRIKLASFLSKENSQPALFIFDEPTTGLHFHDIEKLPKAFDALIGRGHTLIVVEHNPDMINNADYIIELGPDGGENGGEIIYAGIPANLKQN